MKILVMTQMYPEPDDVDGHSQTRTVEYFAKEWVKAGHEVVVIHNSSKFPMLFYFVPRFVIKMIFHGKHILRMTYSSRKQLQREEYGIKIVRFPMFKLWQGRKSSEKTIAQQEKKIIDYLNSIDFKPDWMIGHFAYPQVQLIYDLKEKYGCKTSIVFHRDCTQANVDRYELKKLIQSFDAIGARSEHEAIEIKNNLGLSQKPFVCYSGLPDKIITESSYSDLKFETKFAKVAYAGGLEQEKGVFALVDAFHSIYKNDEDGHLSIIGEGSQMQKLKGYIESIKADEFYTLYGWMKRQDVLLKMKEAQCFTMVSVGETFGMVYMEAMLCGCIVIASKNGGFDGIIKHGHNGFLCESNNAEKLAQLYNDIRNMSVDELKTISLNAYNTAIEYSDSAVAKEYLTNISTYKTRLLDTE